MYIVLLYVTRADNLHDLFKVIELSSVWAIMCGIPFSGLAFPAHINAIAQLTLCLHAYFENAWL